ncbi:MAG: aminoglycoside 3'-phosphotransferase [Oscillospiraceae bacterium]|nr:aminoglycoside 3'-phosphotransferase [Oscillospiraceae bacterium]
MLPEKISAFVKGRPYTVDSVGCSGSEVRIYEDMVLKIEPRSEAVGRQVQLLRWLEGKLPVPKVLCFEEAEGRLYLLMSRIEGEMSCSEYYEEHAAELLRLTAEAFRMLWSVDITDCPADRSLDAELAELDKRELPEIDLPGFQDAAELLRWLKENKPAMDPVFSHGDPCMPNIFFADGKVSGFIDLGDAGIADRYRDIAICLGSLRRNMGGFYGGKVYEDFDPKELFRYLGIEPDHEKLRYYTLLNELY